ncbi:sulfatase-like hydrolase/transferase [Nocardioides sp. CFH 31398]|uniref:sulfatase-like hydrolase/transferase n=1 Tax=Nocardioides sp. CFH 31398 TaxID=2919579 RepID=UPI001F066E29|nr:sulfatase-like hydrolase/transferase [Nocardioides sp. CFH 31398]MCH1866011.1 sulfatase-like hydrolase/transferase [Nocardioides sp. CFH 31398]
MRTAVASVCGALVLTSCTSSGPGPADPADPTDPTTEAVTPRLDDERPNVVMVLVDDLGWGDLGSGRLDEGNPNRFVDTPAIDRLVRDGMAFPNGYGALSCAPSRMALLTGQYPQGRDNGVYGGIDLNAMAPRYDGPEPRLRGIDNRSRSGGSWLSSRSVTIPERMAEAGYWNAHVGKFDVTAGAGQITEQHGYDVSYGGGPFGSPATYTARPKDGGGWTWGARVDETMEAFAEPYSTEYLERDVLPHATGVDTADVLALDGEPKNLTDAVGDAALTSIEQGAATGGPFAVQVNEFAVHSPVGPAEARPDLLAKYEDRSRPGDGRVPAYAAMVENVDQTVGRIVDLLQTREDPRNPGEVLAENTVVVLMSDNGGRIRYNGRDQRRIGGDNGPLRGEKLQLWEGGIRVPTAVWSGSEALVRSGVVNRSIVHVTDVAATFADYAEVPGRVRRGLDGQSLREAFARNAEVSRPLLQHYPGYSLGKGRDQRPATVMRIGSYVVRFDYESLRLGLYDVARQPSQRTDLARARPRLVRRLGRAMAEELDRLNTPLARLRAESAPVRIVLGPGATTYADGRLRRYDRRTVLRVRAGDEMPLVVD